MACEVVGAKLMFRIVTVLNQVLARSGREEQATMTTLTGLVVVLMIVAEKIAELDVYNSFAQNAIEQSFVCPDIDESSDFIIMCL